MRKGLSSHLTYANVMATIAVFLALGGGIAWALANNSVKSKHIKNGQVKFADIADNVEPTRYRYERPIGSTVQETVLNVNGFRIAAECENTGGLPELTLFITYPADGRTASHGALSETGSATAPVLGERAVDGGVPVVGSAIPPGEGDKAEIYSTQTYTAGGRSALLTINVKVDDDESGASLCRVNGVLVPTA